jgi:hypothetical protein
MLEIQAEINASQTEMLADRKEMKVKTAGRNKEAETKEEASREIMLAFLE